MRFFIPNTEGSIPYVNSQKMASHKVYDIYQNH
jgi:hypothetical protein